jgi:hypothetical protein
VRENRADSQRRSEELRRPGHFLGRETGCASVRTSTASEFDSITQEEYSRLPNLRRIGIWLRRQRPDQVVDDFV